jgi:hypothetical protein
MPVSYIRKGHSRFLPILYRAPPMSTSIVPSISGTRNTASGASAKSKGTNRPSSRGDRISAARAIEILGWPKKKFYRALKTYAGDPIVVPVANKSYRKIETVPMLGGEKHDGAAWEFSLERCQEYAETIKGRT